MDNDKYFEVLGKIKELKPAIPDPQALTAKTMINIERISKRKVRKKPLFYFTWVTSIAASFLLGLFLFEHFEYENDTEIKKSLPTPQSYVSGYDVNIEKIQNWNDINYFVHKKIAQKNKLQSMYSTVIYKHKI